MQLLVTLVQQLYLTSDLVCQSGYWHRPTTSHLPLYTVPFFPNVSNWPDVDSESKCRLRFKASSNDRTKKHVFSPDDVNLRQTTTNIKLNNQEDIYFLILPYYWDSLYMAIVGGTLLLCPWREWVEVVNRLYSLCLSKHQWGRCVT